ncbi:hypothetical protein NLG97_g2864 [Lecanicillium saksenae]|uniref:Uncharacterized protein n=1 Tax=Lecanicillium saksenae TaxID=468837 RepID=A0ACC1R0Y9_9HYPO|nr:hypothetical protein NLG97_g2864 [Lecanicillium saksenae]
MGFDFDLENGEKWVDRDESGVFCGNYIFEHAENEEEVREAEAIHQWRALMNDAWRALAGNMLVTELIIEQFLPKWVSYFRTDEFCRFLSRLHSVRMSIYGESDGAGWGSNRVEGYDEAIGEVSDIFFRNMKNVRTLTLIASPYGAFGGSDSLSVQLPLKPTHLPELQEFYLGNAFLDDDVVAFIHQRSQTIRHLDLSGCMGDAYSREGLGTWSSLFSQLQTMELPKLVSFSAGGRIMPCPRSFWKRGGPVSWGGLGIAHDWVDDLADSDTAYHESDNEWTNDQRKLWRYIKSNSKIQPFQYCLLDDECGYISACASRTLESAQDGRDQIAYESLLKYVHQNKMRMIQEASGR